MCFSARLDNAGKASLRAIAFIVQMALREVSYRRLIELIGQYVGGDKTGRLAVVSTARLIDVFAFGTPAAPACALTTYQCIVDFDQPDSR